MQNPEQFKPQNNEKKIEPEKGAPWIETQERIFLEKLVLDMAKTYKGEPVPELQTKRETQ